MRKYTVIASATASAAAMPASADIRTPSRPSAELGQSAGEAPFMARAFLALSRLAAPGGEIALTIGQLVASIRERRFNSLIVRTSGDG